MKCSVCGTESDSLFCPQCGAPLKAQETFAEINPQQYKSSTNRKRKTSRKNTFGALAFIASFFTLFGTIRAILSDSIWVMILLLAASIVLTVFAFKTAKERNLKKGLAVTALIFCCLSVTMLLPALINSASPANTLSTEDKKIVVTPAPTPVPTATPIHVYITGSGQLPDGYYDSFIDACTAAEIPLSDISDGELTSDDPLTIEFSYSDCLFSAVFNDTGTVTLKSGEVTFIKADELLETADNRIVSTTEKYELKSSVKKFIKDNLISPVSADFPGNILDPFADWEFTKNGNSYVVSSYVDSSNAFGVIIRNTFTVNVTLEDGMYYMSMKGFNK